MRTSRAGFFAVLAVFGIGCGGEAAMSPPPSPPATPAPTAPPMPSEPAAKVDVAPTPAPPPEVKPTAEQAKTVEAFIGDWT